MKSRQITLLMIFLFGWLAGSLFTLMYLSHERTKVTQLIYSTTTEPSSNFLKRNQTPASPFPSPVSYLQRNLPFHSFQSNLTFREYPIFLDWPLDDKLFTKENYLALESLLVSYPSAKVRILLTTSKDTIQFKVGNLLSVRHFIKYKKLGYDVQVVAVDQMIQSRGPGYGTNYWTRWSKGCCQSCDAECRSHLAHELFLVQPHLRPLAPPSPSCHRKGNRDHIQPFHLLFYIRLCRLWRRGGLATDFSFLFLAPLLEPKIQQVTTSTLQTLLTTLGLLP
jgi:hypothetical protein